MATFLSVLCWLDCTLPLRGWWEGMALCREEAGASIVAFIFWIQYCWVRSFGPLLGWEMTCLHLPGTLSVSTSLFRPFLNTSCHELLTFCTQSQDSGKRSATQSHCLVTCCVWSMMLSKNTAGVYPRNSPVPSARGPSNWLRACVAVRRKLSRKVVLGIMPVSDSVFLALPFKAHVRGENALCMRESVTERARVIWSFLIALTTNFKCAACVPRFPMSKHTALSTFKGGWGFPKYCDNS